MARRKRTDRKTEEVRLREFLRRIAKAGNALDAEAAAALFSEDVLVDDFSLNRPSRGRKVIRELFGGVFGVMSWMNFDAVGAPLFSSDPPVAACRWRVTGETKQGFPVDFESIDIYRLSLTDGLISEYTVIVRDPDWLGRITP